MIEQANEKATAAEVKQIVNPETAEPKIVRVAGQDVRIAPLPYRWQVLFWKHALPIYEAEIDAAERIGKELMVAVETRTAPTMSFARELIAAEIDSVSLLDSAGAVILASKIEGAAKDPEAHISTCRDTLRDASNIDELRALVDAQADKERLVQRVGERSPVRFAWLLNLAGAEKITPDSLKQLLNNLLSKLQEKPAGAGS